MLSNIAKRRQRSKKERIRTRCTLRDQLHVSVQDASCLPIQINFVQVGLDERNKTSEAKLLRHKLARSSEFIIYHNQDRNVTHLTTVHNFIDRHLGVFFVVCLARRVHWSAAQGQSLTRVHYNDNDGQYSFEYMI
jgi:arginine deiminase